MGPPHPHSGLRGPKWRLPSINVLTFTQSFPFTSAFNPISQRGASLIKLATNAILISIIGGGSERRGEERGGGGGGCLNEIFLRLLNYQRTPSYLAWPAHYFFLFLKMNKNTHRNFSLKDWTWEDLLVLSPLPTDTNSQPRPLLRPPLPLHPVWILRFI